MLSFASKYQKFWKWFDGHEDEVFNLRAIKNGDLRHRMSLPGVETQLCSSSLGGVFKYPFGKLRQPLPSRDFHLTLSSRPQGIGRADPLLGRRASE